MNETKESKIVLDKNDLSSQRLELAKQIQESVRRYFSLEDPLRNHTSHKIPLHAASYGAEEVNEVIDSLLSTQVTMGEKVKKFESLWAEYLGVRNAIMVNSGSSANLIAASVLSNPEFPNRIEPGDEVIVPAIAWSTTYYPLVNIGAVPVFVDVEMETFTIDVEAAERAISPRTRAIVPVHLLGNPCDMKGLLDLANRHNLFVLEDACEAHGAQFNGKKVGSIGHIGSFSFYFSHHISTVEGGMVVTSDDRIADLARILRAHGWQRDVRKKIKQTNSLIDERFLFINLGYNLRPMEFQGAFGIHQIKKIEDFIQRRRENAQYWNSALSKHSDWLSFCRGRETCDSRSVWFGYPITIKTTAPFSREELVRFLANKGVETRPIMAGNFCEQPAIHLFPHKVSGPLKNTDFIMRRSFFVGNYPGLNKSDLSYLVTCVDEFMEQWI